MIRQAVSVISLAAGVGVAASPEHVVGSHFDNLRNRAVECAEWLGEASMASLSLPQPCQPFEGLLRVPREEQAVFKREHPYSEAEPPKYYSESGADFLESATRGIDSKEADGKFAVRGLVGAMGALRLLFKAGRRQSRKLNEAIAASR